MWCITLHPCRHGASKIFLQRLTEQLRKQNRKMLFVWFAVRIANGDKKTMSIEASVGLVSSTVVKPIIVAGGRKERQRMIQKLVDARELMEKVLNHPRPYRKDFYKMLKDAPEVVHAQWIPVSERLPEKNVNVLVIDRVTGEITTAHLNDFDSFVFNDGRGHGASHWMPLPEPPK